MPGVAPRYRCPHQAPTDPATSDRPAAANLGPGSGLRRPGLLALDLGTPGSPAGGSPVTYQRPPDRAARVQVVRPVGRSTWTRPARPGRDGPAPPGSQRPTGSQWSDSKNCRTS